MLILVFDMPEGRNKFVILYETHGKTVCYILSRYNLNRHTKEDLSYGTYIIFAEHLDSIDINDHKKTRNYITTIIRNYHSNYLRNKSKYPEDFLDEIPEPQTSSDGISDYLITKEQIHQLAEGVHKLDDAHKSVSELEYTNGFSNDEITSLLKIKKKTVGMRLYHVNLILREKLKEQGNA